MELVDRIKQVAAQKNLTLKKIELDLGFSNGTIGKWKDSSPTLERILAVADYLNVSLMWLIGRNEQSFEDSSFLNKYNSLSPTDKIKIENFLSIATLSDTPLFQYPSKDSTDDSLTLHEDSLPYGSNSHSHIAVLGKVAARKPIEGISIPLDYISAPVNADYALIAQGHSMEPVIQDGDYIYVKNCNELHTGDIGIFYIDGEVTCKKYYPQPDCIILKSLNPDFTPFKYPLNNWHDFKIQGKVLLSNEQLSRSL